MIKQTKSFSVTIVEMSHYQDPDGEYEICGFSDFDTAREFARRWVRNSIEELRGSEHALTKLRQMWFFYGEDALTTDGKVTYQGSMELDFFIQHPADKNEIDWQSLNPDPDVSG